MMLRKILYYVAFGLLLVPMLLLRDQLRADGTIVMTHRANQRGDFGLADIQHNFSDFVIIGRIRQPEKIVEAKIRRAPARNEVAPPPVRGGEAEQGVVSEVRKEREGNPGTVQSDVYVVVNDLPPGAQQVDPYASEDIALLEGFEGPEGGYGGGSGEGVGDGPDPGPGFSNAELAELSGESAAAAAAAFAQADRAYSIGFTLIQDQSNSVRNLPNFFFDFSGETNRRNLKNPPLGKVNIANTQHGRSRVNLPKGAKDLDKPDSPARLARQKQNEKDQGDPVDLRTGEFTYDAALFSATDPIAGDININASFQGDLLRGPPGPVGAGFTHTYYEQIIEQGAHDVNFVRSNHRLLYQQGDGSIITFTLSGDYNTVGPFRPMTITDLQQIDFCLLADVEATQKLNGAYTNDAKAVFLAKGLPYALEKQWAPVVVRDPKMACRGTWRIKYMLKFPDGGKRIFEGVVQSPDLYQLVERCSGGLVNENWDELGIAQPNSGDLICNGEIDGDFVGDDTDELSDCHGNLTNRFARDRYSATQFKTVLDNTKNGYGSILNDMADAELVTTGLGTCEPDQSDLLRFLREENLLTPMGLMLVADRHPPVRTWHAMQYSNGGGRRVGSDNFKVRIDGWHPFGSTSKVEIENMPWDRMDSFTWLAGALGVRKESAGLMLGRTSAEGTFAHSTADWESETTDPMDADDFLIRGGVYVDVAPMRYYRLTDAYDLQWLANGVVAPLRVVEEPHMRMEFKYDFNLYPFVQYLSFATALQGFTACWGDPVGPVAVNDLEFDPTNRAKRFDCGCCGPQPTTIGGILYDRVCNMNCMGTQQTRLESPRKITTLFPSRMTTHIWRGNTELATLGYQFALMRDPEAEREYSFDTVESVQAIRNPSKYKPFRQVFYSAPLLTSVSKPGSQQQTTLSYAASSAQGNCPVNFDESVSFFRFISLEDVFVRNPATQYGRERGWTFAQRPQAGWANCNDLPAADLPSDIYDNLPTFGHVGRDADNLPVRAQIGNVNRFNGPLVLSRINYGVEGAPEWTFNYTIQDDAQQIARLRSRHNIRLTEVRMGDRVAIRNVYDNRGRVTQHTLGDSGTLRYAYGENSTTVTTRAGLSSQYNYNADGQLISRVGWDGTTTQYVYNSREVGQPGPGQLRDTINPDGTRIRYVYAEGFLRSDRLMSHIADNSLTSIHQISTAGRDVLMSRMNFDAEGRNLGFYDKVASLTKLAPNAVNGQDTANIQYRYDYQEPEFNLCNADKPQGNLVKIIYPDGSYEAWKHNRLGQPIFYRNVLGAETAYSYFGSGEGCGQ